MRPRLPRSAALIFAGAGVLLVPWTIWLAYRLPTRHVSPHWDVAWAGFDIALAIFVIGTAAALWRRSPALPLLASIAGTLMFADAWFDVATSREGRELAWAIGGAVLAELPLAALCFWVAWRSLTEPQEAQGPVETGPAAELRARATGPSGTP
jgi:hypothetical protein